MILKRGFILIFVALLLTTLTLAALPPPKDGTPCSYLAYGDSQCNPSQGLYCIGTSCQTTSPQTYCNDPDNQNEYTATTITARYRDYSGYFLETQLEDKCVQNNNVVQTCSVSCKVGEAVCTAQNQPQTIDKSCSGECRYGACIQQQTTQQAPPPQQPSCPDMDNDKVCDTQDTCKTRYNPTQKDSDKDGVGDVCDNCPATANKNQEDKDYDGHGAVCDCDDTSSVYWNNCPTYKYYTPSTPQTPQQHCNDNNVCTTDSYNTALKKCQFTPIAGCCKQDSDCTVGKSCVSMSCCLDRDSDSICDNRDNCLGVYNPNQRDQDHDGYGSACDCNDQNVTVTTKCQQKVSPVPPVSPQQPIQTQEQECSKVRDCNDNKRSTKDTCNQGKCSYERITECTTGDFYCPRNCSVQQDSDCIRVPSPWDFDDATHCYENSYVCYAKSGVAYECVEGNWFAVKAEDRFCSPSICHQGDYMCLDDLEQVSFCKQEQWSQPTKDVTVYRSMCSKAPPTGYFLVGYATGTSQGQEEGKVVITTPLAGQPNIPRRVFRVVPLQKEQCEIKDITYVQQEGGFFDSLQKRVQNYTAIIGALGVILAAGFIMASFFIGKHFGTKQ